MGFAPAELPSSPQGGAEAYDEWIAEGMHGTMDYMARDPERRRSITRWFPEARSVVLLGFGYSTPPKDAGRSRVRGRVARYATSPDYHAILREKLKGLLDEIRSAAPEIRGKIFVDTSPVLERLYGRWAGIGWVGKNTLLLSRKAGSFFLLCGMALDRELIYDEPAPDHCGTCNRCIEACPTDAFPRPRVLDASRCIAYLTIEHRGSIPEPLRAGTGDWVFGCDVCQEVCPWNRFSSRHPAFEPVIAGSWPLEELASMTPEGFEGKLGSTPMERARWEGLVRNALLAMGNSGSAGFIPVLERFAAHSDPVLAEQAKWSLERLRG